MAAICLGQNVLKHYAVSIRFYIMFENLLMKYVPKLKCYSFTKQPPEVLQSIKCDAFRCVYKFMPY